MYRHEAGSRPKAGPGQPANRSEEGDGRGANRTQIGFLADFLYGSVMFVYVLFLFQTSVTKPVGGLNIS